MTHAIESPPCDILLVEDHHATAAALAGVLRRAGYRVIVAHSVAEAITACSLARFEVLISDINLPDGSGRSVMRHVQASGTRGLAVSGLGEPEDIAASRLAGFADHMVKPVRIGHVLDFIVDRPGRESIAAQNAAVKCQGKPPARDRDGPLAEAERTTKE